MSRKSKRSLKSFVQRVLVVRLAVAGLIIAFVIGLAVFLLERNELGERVIAIAIERAKLFNARNVGLFDVPGLANHYEIQHEVESFRSDRAKHEMGSFVFVRLYNADL